MVALNIRESDPSRAYRILESRLRHLNTYTFGSRDEFISTRLTPEVGAIAEVGGVAYVYDGTSTEILDLPGWRPNGNYTPQHFGATGTIKERVGGRVYGYLLSDRFATIADAQAVYPKATALSEGLCCHAAQRMVDALRDSSLRGSGLLQPWLRTQKAISFFFPRGEYVFDRPLDLTGIRGGEGMWELRGDRAVIYHQAVDKTLFDLISTTRCCLSGFNIIGDVLRGVGCPETAILTGRASDGISAGEHRFFDLEITGAFRKAIFHNYASEVNQAYNFNWVNHLDPRQTIADPDDLVGSLSSGETLTWTGGTGTIVTVNANYVIIQVDSGSTPLADGTSITASGGATFDAGDPWAMPSGRGPDGRSFVVAVDPDNYFGTDSDYATNASTDDVASCLFNTYRGSLVHSGKGHCVYLGAGCGWVDFRGAYMAVTGDDDGAANVYAFGNQLSWFRNVCLDMHTESDGGDTDGATGIDFSVLFGAASSSTSLSAFGWEVREMKCNAAVSIFAAESNVDNVYQRGQQTFVGQIGDGPATRRMWEGSSASKFSYSGELFSLETANDDFLNIADIGGFSGYARVNDITESNLSRTTTGGFMVFDETRNAFINAVRLQSVSGNARIYAFSDAAEIGRLQWTTGTAQLDPDGDGDDYVFTDAALYWNGTSGDVDLGTDSQRFGTAHLSDGVTVAGTQVLGPQQAAIADLPTSGTSSVADLETKINAILTVMRTHGGIAT